MKSFKRLLARIDPGFFIVIAICLLALWPFLSNASLPQETDAELHVYRLAELSRLTRSGELFPRWAPNFYYGYGYPLFNYYAPLAYYLALPLELMPGVSPVLAIKILFMAALIGSGIGMYGYVRDEWGKQPGLVAAAVYVYSPYIVSVDPHSRGDVAETLSFAMFPLALWSLDRFRRTPDRWSWLGSVLLVAATILSHNLMAMVLTAILVVWAIWQSMIRTVVMEESSTEGIAKLLWRNRLFGAILLGVWVAAIFWMVVALEQNAVNLGSLIGTGSHFDFRNHFLTPSEMLSLPNLIDWGATEPLFLLILGPAQWLLGGIGILSLLSKRTRQRRQAVFFVMVLLSLLFLMVSQSMWLWDRLPLLPFLQFPWRLLGPTAALLAILSGVAVTWLMEISGSAKNALVPAGLVGLVISFALPNVQVPPWADDFGPTDAARVMVEELSGRWLGTTSTADFVPVTVDTVPKPEPQLIMAYLEGLPIDRVNRATLPTGTEVRSEELTLLHTRFRINGDADFLLRLFVFDFPGWQVQVDGRQVKKELGRPEGFIVLPIPAGKHVVDLRFGNTPARNVASLMSGLSLALTLFVTLRLKHNKAIDSREDSGSSSDKNKLLGTAAVAIGIFILQALIVEPAGWLRYESSGYVVEPAEHSVFADFGGQIALIGYDGPNTRVRGGDRIVLDAYWKAQQSMDINYQVFVHLLDAENTLVAQSDKLNPGDFPTKRWPMDKYVRDKHVIVVPENLPPGEYKLAIGLWSAGGGWRLPLLDENDLQLGDTFVLPQTITIQGV